MVYARSFFLILKLNPWVFMQQVAVKWQSKTLRENVALRAGTTIGLPSLALKRF